MPVEEPKSKLEVTHDTADELFLDENGKSRLIEGGYTIIEDREQGRRYAIITEPKE